MEQAPWGEAMEPTIAQHIVSIFGLEGIWLFSLLVPLLTLVGLIYGYWRWRNHREYVQETLQLLLREVAKLRDDQRIGS